MDANKVKNLSNMIKEALMNSDYCDESDFYADKIGDVYLNSFSNNLLRILVECEWI